jgi:uncharacterized protein YaaQ
MKLIFAIIRDNDWESVSQALVQADLRVTRIASTGGFLRRGTSTLMIGAQDEEVEKAIDIIKMNVLSQPTPDMKRATLFVLNVENYTQI